MLDINSLLQEGNDAVRAAYRDHVNPTFSQVLGILGFDVNYARGQGPYLWDEHGHRYLDCISGFGTFAVGRNHPTVRAAVQQAMDMDLPNLPKFGVPRLSGLLAKRLCALTPGDLEMVFFSNSGAEAVEAAFKFARAATRRPRLISCHNGYHGLTHGALSLTACSEFREPFAPLDPHCKAVAFDDLEALEAELAQGDVAAFIVEPVQGHGVHVPSDDYLPAASELCRKHGALFIADEVQTGFGRTGRMFACEHWNVEPDILVTAKALSGGYVPIGATVYRRWIYDKVFSKLDRCMIHSSTFGQNDLAMTVGLATLEVLEDEHLVENAAAMGRALKQRLESLVDRYEMVKQVRGLGLLLAIDFAPPKSLKLKMGWSMVHKMGPGVFPQTMLIPLLRDHHILAQTAAHGVDVIKLIPSLVISAQDVDLIATGLEDVIASSHRFPGPLWEIGKRIGGVAFGRTRKSQAAADPTPARQGHSAAAATTDR
jgi:ornithine--oxo-acid transaminase